MPTALRPPSLPSQAPISLTGNWSSAGILGPVALALPGDWSKSWPQSFPVKTLYEGMEGPITDPYCHRQEMFVIMKKQKQHKCQSKGQMVKHIRTNIHITQIFKKSEASLWAQQHRKHIQPAVKQKDKTAKEHTQ